VFNAAGVAAEKDIDVIITHRGGHMLLIFF
jgi:hypothetical protein